MLQHHEPGAGETMGSVKHPHLEKNAEKLEKTHKSSMHILRLEQKPWTGFKGGEKLTTCCLQPQGKSSVREGSGELLLHKSREQCPQLLSAVVQEAASLERSCSHSHGSVGLVQAGWEVLWPGWCPWLPSGSELCVRAALQGAAPHSKAGSRRDGGCGVLGEHRGRRGIWKNIFAHPVVRSSTCTWLCP